MHEHWLPVVGYESVYEVSDLGRLRNSRGMILAQEKTWSGYCRFKLQHKGITKRMQVHCIVMEAFTGPKPPKMTVNHKNGKKADNQWDNLEYLTQGENEQHSFDHLGRQSPKGSKHWKSKLTEDLVRQMRIDRKTMPINDVAAKYSVSIGNVSMICNRIKWVHVI